MANKLAYPFEGRPQNRAIPICINTVDTFEDLPVFSGGYSNIDRRPYLMMSERELVGLLSQRLAVKIEYMASGERAGGTDNFAFDLTLPILCRGYTISDQLVTGLDFQSTFTNPTSAIEIPRLNASRNNPCNVGVEQIVTCAEFDSVLLPSDKYWTARVLPLGDGLINRLLFPNQVYFVADENRYYARHNICCEFGTDNGDFLNCVWDFSEFIDPIFGPESLQGGDYTITSDSGTYTHPCGTTTVTDYENQTNNINIRYVPSTDAGRTPL